MRFLAIGLFLVLASPSACASGSARVGSGASPNLIGSWEMQELQDLNTLDVIRRLRPAWLRRRSQPGPVAAQAGEERYPVVHIDGVRQIELEVLTSLPAREVREIQFLSGSEAATRFGTGYSNGAILVRTHR